MVLCKWAVTVQTIGASLVLIPRLLPLNHTPAPPLKRNQLHLSITADGDCSHEIKRHLLLEQQTELNWIFWEKYLRVDQCTQIEPLITTLNTMIIFVILFPSSSDLGIQVISDWSCLDLKCSHASQWSLNFFFTRFGHVIKIDSNSPESYSLSGNLRGAGALAEYWHLLLLSLEKVWIQHISKKR